MIALPVVIAQRCDICRACPHAGKNNDAKYASFKGLTTHSTCALIKGRLKEFVDIAESACPDNHWGAGEGLPTAQPAASTASKSVRSIDVDGPRIWKEWLHGWAVKIDLSTPAARDAAARHLKELRRVLPCGECKTHLDAFVTTNPPDFSSNSDLFNWTWQFHDAVNELKKKPRLSLPDARKLYGLRPGELTVVQV